MTNSIVVGLSVLRVALVVTGLGVAVSSGAPLEALALTLVLLLITVLLGAALEAANVKRSEALQQSVHARKLEQVGSLATGIAHDFNNVLSVISSVADELRALPKLDDKTNALLDELEEATSRGVMMSRQLLSLSQPDVLVNIDLGLQLGALAPMINRLVGAKVEVELGAIPGGWVRATRAGLEQVLLNLTINAGQAMPHGGKLSLHVSATANKVMLTVKDTGVGMDAATQARIFTPLFTTKATGSGIGLATVQEKVTDFGGIIAVESAPGLGTTFTLTFDRVGRRRRSSLITSMERSFSLTDAPSSTHRNHVNRPVA